MLRRLLCTCRSVSLLILSGKMLTLVLKSYVVHQRFCTIPDQHTNNVQEAQVFEA